MQRLFRVEVLLNWRTSRFGQAILGIAIQQCRCGISICSFPVQVEHQDHADGYESFVLRCVQNAGMFDGFI